MSPGNLEFVQVVNLMIVVPLVQAAIVRLDERRLPEDRRARGWSPVTRDAVVFATWQFGILFGCPALVVWFVKTRGWARGAILGIVAAAGLFAAALAAETVPELAVDWLGL